MFDKSVLAAAACLAGFGIVFYFQNNQKKSSDSEKQLVSATYKVYLLDFRVIQHSVISFLVGN
jgi:hypothetical protein